MPWWRVRPRTHCAPLWLRQASSGWLHQWPRAFGSLCLWWAMLLGTGAQWAPSGGRSYACAWPLGQAGGSFGCCIDMRRLSAERLGGTDGLASGRAGVHVLVPWAWLSGGLDVGSGQVRPGKQAGGTAMPRPEPGQIVLRMTVRRRDGLAWGALACEGQGALAFVLSTFACACMLRAPEWLLAVPTIGSCGGAGPLVEVVAWERCGQAWAGVTGARVPGSNMARMAMGPAALGKLSECG